MSVAVYLRVSTNDQNPESQRAEIEAWLARNSITAVTWYEDHETGKTLKRPAFQRLQKSIGQGSVDTVVVWKLDRLARKFSDGMKLLGQWLEMNVRIVSVTQPIDLSGPIGQAVAGILFAFAEIELQSNKERQSAGIKVAKAAGKYTGRKAGTTKAKPARARELRERGLQISEIARSLNVTERTVHRYLK